MEAEQKQRLLLSEDIPHPPKYPKSWSWRNSLTFVLLFFSLGANIFIFPVHILGQSGSSSPNLGLRENVHDMQRWHSTVYSHPNETVRDEAWKAIDIDRSIVAVDHKEAAALGLPPTRIFPWDDGKGVYVLNVYHQFHCLKLLYTTLQETRQEKPWSIEYVHLLHCLDSLRGDLECMAHDHLYYISDKNNPPTGEGQVMKCRDFKKLDKWAMEHNACYKYMEADDEPPPSEIHQWRNCPNDSKFSSKMREFFGYDENWVPEFKSNHNPEFPDQVHDKAGDY